MSGPAHSKLGASSMHRWSVCPGSVNLAKDCPNNASAYAEEGSDAHALGAWCLKNRHPHVPQKYVGTTVNMEDREFEVTSEMAAAVNVYLEHLADSAGGVHVDLIEHRFDLSSVYPGCFGTADHVRWVPAEKLLIVTDYKHGAGIFVSAMENPQLMYYALGALVTLGYPAARVRMEIVQPRCEANDGGVRYEEIDALDLIDFAADLVTYAKATEDPNAPLVSGEHCKFCPAARTCPVVEGQSRALAKLEFSSVIVYDPNELAGALEMIPAIEARIKAIREFAYEEAEAGRTPPRHKLVAKRATRRWKDSDGADMYLAMRGFHTPADIYEPAALKSPAQIEKLKGIKKGDLDAYISAESSGHVLAPQDDKRPAISISTARDEFKAIAPPN